MNKTYWRTFVEVAATCVIGIYIFTVVLFLSLLSETNFSLIDCLERCNEFVLVSVFVALPIIAIAIWNARRLEIKRLNQQHEYDKLRKHRPKTKMTNRPIGYRTKK